MHKTIVRLAALAGLALALQAPAAPASVLPGDQDDAFVIASFGICYYPAERPDDYFGINARCPRDPMPPDTHPRQDNGDQDSSGFLAGFFGLCWYGDQKSDHYFGINHKCPLDPMPGDYANGG
jgi:hypothetical protein